VAVVRRRQLPGGFEVSNRALVLLTLGVRLAPTVKGRHRVWPQRQGAAEVFNRDVALTIAHGQLTLGHSGDIRRRAGHGASSVEPSTISR
jgi:hypothetical protein